ncbi:AzlD domain-containing protein [Pseudalkalibacillus berkeleyi]|uniref:AzlD domain-containing protein n=1 Tax=Pseudalkalibacillus berkeleyi TaxID=1069813 RepID=A0ABS9GXC0_9BACL|nr:AzlD domain-containing protein [Pseudalkalibacillus berkeleyi]MCF6136250.1 AzlD domain-containing protein [Pseudalkalibacillus berkeleyi]
MFNTYIWIILGMAVVTYIPRMLPLVAFQTDGIPTFLRGVLKNVPYAILGALIFPGILTFNGEVWMGILGALTAFVAAYFGASLIVIVICSVSVLSVLSFLFP